MKEGRLTESVSESESSPGSRTGLAGGEDLDAMSIKLHGPTPDGHSIHLFLDDAGTHIPGTRSYHLLHDLHSPRPLHRASG